MAIASCTISASEELGTTSDAALECNSSTLDSLINGTETVTSRIGKELLSVSQLEQNFIMTAVNGGVWASGQTFTAFNQFMVFNTTAYKSKITSTLPLTVGSTPDLNFVEPFDLSSGIGIRQSKLDSPLVSLFKKNKTVDTLAGTLTTLRSTIATFVDRYGIVRTAAIDTLREDRDGILYEGPSTNLLIRSDEYDNAAWVKESATITANTANAPDLTATADKLIIDNAASLTAGQARQVLVKAASPIVYTWSAYVKETDYNRMRLVVQGDFSSNGADLIYTFSSETLVVTNFGDFPSVGLKGEFEKLTDGWVRLKLSFTTNSDTSIHSRLQNSDTVITLGDGIKGNLIWRGQLEPLGFASSSIQTTATAEPRTIDKIKFLVLNNYLSLAEGDNSFFMKYKLLGDTGVNQFLIQTKSTLGAVNKFGAFSSRITGSVVYRSGSSGAGEESTTPDLTIGVEHSIALVSESGVLKAYGDSIFDDQQTPTPTDTIDLTEVVFIGTDDTGAIPMYGHITDFRIYDFALNDREVDFLSG